MSTTFRSIRPIQGEYAPYYDTYITLVPAGDIVTTLAHQQIEALKLLSGLADDQAMFRYGPDKWNIKEVVGHVVDAERIFGYRALCFARNSQAALPSMEQNEFARYGGHAKRPWASILAEYDHLRTSTLDLLGSIDEDAWLRHGTASGYDVSVRALAWIIAGHEAHHRTIIRDRYLKP